MLVCRLNRDQGLLVSKPQEFDKGAKPDAGRLKENRAFRIRRGARGGESGLRF